MRFDFSYRDLDVSLNLLPQKERKVGFKARLQASGSLENRLLFREDIEAWAKHSRITVEKSSPGLSTEVCEMVLVLENADRGNLFLSRWIGDNWIEIVVDTRAEAEKEVEKTLKEVVQQVRSSKSQLETVLTRLQQVERRLFAPTLVRFEWQNSPS